MVSEEMGFMAHHGLTHTDTLLFGVLFHLGYMYCEYLKVMIRTLQLLLGPTVDVHTLGPFVCVVPYWFPDLIYKPLNIGVFLVHYKHQRSLSPLLCIQSYSIHLKPYMYLTLYKSFGGCFVTLFVTLIQQQKNKKGGGALSEWWAGETFPQVHG
jgi:hypothetical protein